MTASHEGGYTTWNSNRAKVGTALSGDSVELLSASIEGLVSSLEASDYEKFYLRMADENQLERLRWDRIAAKLDTLSTEQVEKKLGIVAIVTEMDVQNG